MVHEPGAVRIEARDMSGVFRRHHHYLKGASRPFAKAEKDLRALRVGKLKVKPTKCKLLWLGFLGT